MSTKRRSPGQEAVSISLQSSLLADIDRRATSLGLNRSQYLSLLARNDLKRKGELTIPERTSSSEGQQKDTSDPVVGIVKRHHPKRPRADPPKVPK